MRIYRHSRLPEGYGLYHVGRLPAYARQIQQGIHILWHLALMFLHQLAGHLHQVLCLGVGVAHATDIIQYLVGFGLCHLLGIRVTAEQVWCDLIHALVCALCTQHHRHQQLKHTAIRQFGIHLWHLLAEVLQYQSVSLFSPH